MKKTWNWLKLQKEGILIGVGAAVLIYWKHWNFPVPIAETGLTKLAIMTLILSTIGALLDSWWKPRR